MAVGLGGWITSLEDWSIGWGVGTMCEAIDCSFCDTCALGGGIWGGKETIGYLWIDCKYCKGMKIGAKTWGATRIPFFFVFYE